MISWIWNFFKKNCTIFLLILIALLVLTDIYVRVGYTQLTGEQFNNWLSPIISFGGFIAIIITLLITRRDIIDRASQPFYEFHSKIIDEFVDEKRRFNHEILLKFFQTDERFKDGNIDRINFHIAYMSLFGILIYEKMLKLDIAKLRKGKNIHINTFKSQDYHQFIEYLSCLRYEIEIFYSILAKKILQNIVLDHRLSGNARDLLYRHINRYILRQYIYFCTNLPDIEFYEIYDNVPTFENFKTDDVLGLFNYIKSVPELKSNFIPEKYW